MSDMKKAELASMIDTARYCRHKATQLTDKALRIALLDLADAYEEAIAEQRGEPAGMTGKTLH